MVIGVAELNDTGGRGVEHVGGGSGVDDVEWGDIKPKLFSRSSDDGRRKESDIKL